MSKTAQILNLVAEASNTANTTEVRIAALQNAKALKRSMKISFEKIGLSTNDVAKLEETLTINTNTNNNVVNEVVETEIAETAPKSKGGRKPGRLREQVMAEIELMSGVARKDRIKTLMDKFGITKYNAAYYVDRVLP